MADRQGTQRERARKRARIDDAELDRGAHFVICDRRDSERTATASAKEPAEGFRTVERRPRAYYERFVPRFVVQGLLADIRGTRRRRAADGASVTLPMSPEAAASFGHHALLATTLDRLVMLREQDHTDTRDEKAWAGIGRALRRVHRALVLLPAGRKAQREYVRRLLAAFTEQVRAARARPNGRPRERTISAELYDAVVRAISAALRALRSTVRNVAQRFRTNAALDRIERAFADALVPYFTEFEGDTASASVVARRAAAHARIGLYAIMRDHRFPAGALEALYVKHRGVERGSSFAVWFVATWRGVSQSHARRALRAAMPRAQEREVLTGQRSAVREHSTTHESPSPPERARRAPNLRRSGGPPRHDPTRLSR